MQGKAPAYVRGRGLGKATRVIVIIPNDELAAIDGWGIPAEMPSRAAAIRFLLRKGLEAVGADPTKR